MIYVYTFRYEIFCFIQWSNFITNKCGHIDNQFVHYIITIFLLKNKLNITGSEGCQIWMHQNIPSRPCCSQAPGISEDGRVKSSKNT